MLQVQWLTVQWQKYWTCAYKILYFEVFWSKHYKIQQFEVIWSKQSQFTGGSNNHIDNDWFAALGLVRWKVKTEKQCKTKIEKSSMTDRTTGKVSIVESLRKRNKIFQIVEWLTKGETMKIDLAYNLRKFMPVKNIETWREAQVLKLSMYGEEI